MARRRTPRGLRPDEEELWQRVARSADPLHPRRRDPDPTPPARTFDPKRPDPPRPDLDGFAIGGRAGQTAPHHDIAPSLSARIAAQPVRMDARAFVRMKRGKLGIDGRIDLHGMTLDRAHGALTRFIVGSHAQGKRLVLVITGKGRDRDDGGPVPQRRGALKQQVPRWLSLPPLGSLVLQVAEAHRSHGGSGAYYVYLRRGR